MGGDADAALRRQPRRLVDDDGVLVHVDDKALGIFDLLGAERRTLVDHRPRRCHCRQHIGPGQRLAGGDAVAGRGLGTIQPQRPGAGPARDDVEAGVGRMPLEPAVEPDAVVILGDDGAGHQARASQRPANTASTAPVTEASA